MSTSKVTFDSNRFLDVMRRKTGARIERAVQEAIEKVADDAKKYAYKEVADAMKISNVKTTRVSDGLTISASAYVLLDDVVWARAVEKGSGLHDPNREATIDIDAREAPTLVFWWERMDVLFRGRHVNHPGVKARPYLSRALNENKKRILRTLKARVNGK